MTNVYLLAVVNLLLSSAVAYGCLCRLAKMDGDVLKRVQSEYAVYMGACGLSAFSPWFGEWPGMAQIGVMAALLFGMVCSSHAWTYGPPPSSQRADL